MLKRHKRKLIALGVFLLIVGLVYGFRYPILIQIGSYPVVQSALRQADLIAVLPIDWRAVKYPIKLYREGYAPKILFIGHDPTELMVSNSDQLHVVEIPWREVAKRMALTQGIREEDVLVSTNEANSTYEQVQQVVKVVQENGYRSIIVVSDPLHMRRVSWIAGRLLKNKMVELVHTPVPQEYYLPGEQYDPDRWWADEYSVKSLFSEYLKLGFYLFNYR